MSGSSLAALGVLLATAPALPGVATRTRSFLTGRRGPPVLQLYFELAKLVRKRAVYSAVTTGLFRWAPVSGLTAVLLAACLLPLDGQASLIGFAGDFVMLAGLLALGRLLVILAALDTGSSFEGMGASRDAMIGAVAEPGLFLVFAALVLATGQTTLSGMLGPPLASAWRSILAPLAMLAVSLFVLLIAETSRGPVDDPATHLELTMIHEVAILDYSGPDLALVLYGSSLKFALLAALAAGVIAPRAALGAPAAVLALAPGLLLVASGVGVVEAVMARLRMNRVPRLLVATAAVVAFATILLLEHP